MEKTFCVEISDFSLSETLECGQCFRWTPTGSGYRGVVGRLLINMHTEGGKLVVSGCSKHDYDTWFARYLGLDGDYARYKEILSADPTLKQAIGFAPGIRIMRQPFWETLCSFIISQNNNIPRITGIIERLCDNFGERCDGYFCFPEAETLAPLVPDDLAPIRAGFRAAYIIDAARKVADGTVSEHAIEKMSLSDARASLMQIKGVGPKVADCVLLFGLGRLDAFPEDVWIKRAMAQLFPNGLPDYALPIAGIAQQYIFHYARKSGIIER